MRIGVLALQGDFAAHRRALEPLATTVLVRTPGDLDELDALVLPGGESGAHLRLLAETGLEAAIPAFHAAGGALFGTCAGAILLAKRVSGPEQRSFGLIDLDIQRNAYGRQLASFETEGEWGRLVFIRAPRITRSGPGVQVLASHEGDPILAREGRVLVATFHPELTPDSRVHRFFVAEVVSCLLVNDQAVRHEVVKAPVLGVEADAQEPQAERNR